MMRLAILVVVALVALTPACSSEQNRRAAVVTVVAAGAAVTTLQAANHVAYRGATDMLIARGVLGHNYEVAARPIDSEFEARGAAIRVLALALYAVAHQLDEPGSVVVLGAGLEAIDAALATLTRGGVLPALAIPAEVTTAVTAMRAVVPR